jgi:hypothetical protein
MDLQSDPYIETFVPRNKVGQCMYVGQCVLAFSQRSTHTHTDLVAVSAKVKFVAVFHPFIDVHLQNLSVSYHLVSVTLLALIFLWTQAQTDKQRYNNYM